MTTITEYVVNDLNQTLDAIVKASKKFDAIKPWWRGQAVLDWDLLPTCRRPGISASEINLTFRFKNMAKARHRNCPDNSDLAGWLFLMQHYRLPTRLLDWSESPLVAMFFAIEDRNYDNFDGVLWALHPGRLNHNQCGEYLCFDGDDSHVAQLFQEAFNPPTDKPAENVLCVLTDQIDPRPMLQQSVCTIHGASVPLNKLPESEDFLIRIRIPKDRKENFRLIFDLLRVSRETLFPDLENLASALSKMKFRRVP